MMRAMTDQQPKGVANTGSRGRRAVSAPATSDNICSKTLARQNLGQGAALVYDTRRMVREAMKRGLSRHHLARAAGVSSSTVCRFWEGRGVHVTTLRLLAQALEMDLADLVVEADA